MIRYEVRFQTPYNNQEWRSQFFNTMKEAESMVSFLSLLWFKVLYGIIIEKEEDVCLCYTRKLHRRV
jgi:hypothetical protein